ncbi:MAG: alpha-isopropylmalate synthase regulatory domain-containing protein, partial [bacterium]
NKIKEMENHGFNFESADGSFKMLLNKYSSKKYNNYFKLISFRVAIEKNTLLNNIEDNENNYNILSEAVVMLDINGNIQHTVALGDGPVNALDNALRKSLLKFYPVLNEMKLSDFKVRVINSSNMKSGTGSFVRVLIESSDKTSKWTTIGVSENIIEASYQALVDSINYKLIKENI